MCVSDHLVSGVFWETTLLIIHFFLFFYPDKPFSCKETLPWLYGVIILESTHWHGWSTNTTGEKGGANLLGRMGCFSGRLFALKLNSIQCYKEVLRKPSWKCLKITVSLTAILEAEPSAMGETDLSSCFQHSVCCHFYSSLLSLSARKCFTTCPLWRQDRQLPCAEMAKRAKLWDMIKWWLYTALVQTFFCLQPWGREQREKGYARKQEAMCSGGRIRCAEVPIFAFLTNRCSMQTKFPCAKLLGLQCSQWFKLTDCT